MSNWKNDAADANLRMAMKMLEQQEALNAVRADAERLTDAALGVIAEADRDTMRFRALHAAILEHYALVEQQRN